ncbi:hypothetical protein, partial [Roseibium sp.]|uniref:hypothetical protein n=1 Tax=Roseibium sp. TaxID=1936156 RepID=UPI003D109F83
MTGPSPALRGKKLSNPDAEDTKSNKQPRQQRWRGFFGQFYPNAAETGEADWRRLSVGNHDVADGGVVLQCILGHVLAVAGL